MVARIKMKLGIYAISMTITCFYDDHILPPLKLPKKVTLLQNMVLLERYFATEHTWIGGPEPTVLDKR